LIVTAALVHEATARPRYLAASNPTPEAPAKKIQQTQERRQAHCTGRSCVLAWGDQRLKSVTMFTPRVIFKRRPIADISVDIWDHEWSATPEYESAVDSAWQKRLFETKYLIWDGTYYRVTNLGELENEAAAQKFRLGTIRYRYIATFPELHRVHLQCQLEALYHLSTIALIQTSDDYYLFGKRMRNGAIDIIDGGVQKDEMAVSCGADVERNLFKEIHEEVGISGNDIDQMIGIGTLLSGTSNVLVVGHVHSRLSKAAVELQFAERSDNEMVEPVFVPGYKLCTFLRGMSDYRNLIPDLL
jgi:hypothetical protein